MKVISRGSEVGTNLESQQILFLGSKKGETPSSVASRLETTVRLYLWQQEAHTDHSGVEDNWEPIPCTGGR